MKSSNNGKPDNDDDQPRLAVLIDADNAQPSVIEGLLAEVAQVRRGQRQAHLWRLHLAPRMTQWKAALLRALDQPGAAVRLHQRQERHRQLADHRCDGPAVHAALRWLLPGLQRQRLHPPGPAPARGGPDGVRLRREEDAGCLRAGLRQVHLHRSAAHGAGGQRRSRRRRSRRRKPRKGASPPKPAPPAPATPAGAAPDAPGQGRNGPPSRLPLALIRQAIEEASDDEGWALPGQRGQLPQQDPARFRPAPVRAPQAQRPVQAPARAISRSRSARWKAAATSRSTSACGADRGRAHPQARN